MSQESKQKKRISITNFADVSIERLEKTGAEKSLVQYLIDERHGSSRFSLRLYTVQKGGHTPLDEHVYEHQVYILSGQGLLMESRDSNAPLRTLGPGDSIFIPSNAVHQFSNPHETPLVFLCVKGNPDLYLNDTTGEKNHSDQNYC